MRMRSSISTLLNPLQISRTLDDSANRRTLFPETFLSLDEIVMALAKIIDGLKVNPVRMQRNLEKFGPFAAVERVMLAAARKGADRQEMHETLRQLSMAAWQAVEKGEANPLAGLVMQDERVTCWVAPSDLRQLFAVEGYTGIAETRAREMAGQIHACIQ